MTMTILGLGINYLLMLVRSTPGIRNYSQQHVQKVVCPGLPTPSNSPCMAATLHPAANKMGSPWAMGSDSTQLKQFENVRNEDYGSHLPHHLYVSHALSRALSWRPDVGRTQGWSSDTHNRITTTMSEHSHQKVLRFNCLLMLVR